MASLRLVVSSTLLPRSSSSFQASATRQLIVHHCPSRRPTAYRPRSSHLRVMGSTTSVSADAFAGKTVHDFTVKNIEGKDVTLGDFKGKVLLIVNVASQCGLTPQYAGLQELYDKYAAKGFEVLAFPCNQFGAQEPGSNEQIKEFACSRFKATFPMFDKVDVNGPNAAPLYQFLRSQKGGGILGDAIKWNFGKFLVDKEGKVVERYAPTTAPSAIAADVEKLL